MNPNDLMKEIFQVKGRLKELHNFLGKLYNNRQKKKAANIYFIKRNIDKLGKTLKYLDNIDLNEDARGIKADRSKKEDIDKIYNLTKNNLKIMNAYYNEKLRKSMNTSEGDVDALYRKNLDTIKLASDSLKRFDPNMNMQNKEWIQEIKEI